MVKNPCPGCRVSAIKQQIIEFVALICMVKVMPKLRYLVLGGKTWGCILGTLLT